MNKERVKRLKLNEYQKAAKDTIVYPQRTLSNNSLACSYETGVLYNALNLASEAGEVAGKIAKAIRKDSDIPVDGVIDELGDCLWSIAVLADELGYSLAEVAMTNLEKLSLRKERGVIAGEGDNR